MRVQATLKNALAIAAIVLLPLITSTSAQAVLTATDLAPFLGDWTLALDTPQGSMPVTLSVKNQEGKVEGEVGSDLMPAQAITDISKAEKSLVMKYMLDFQGNAVPVKITLTPDGDKMKFVFDAAEGQFFLEGLATKK
jgi:hypothetical protein